MKTVGDLMKTGCPFVIDSWVYYPLTAESAYVEYLRGGYSGYSMVLDKVDLNFLLKQPHNVDWFEDCNTKERWEILQEKCCCPIISLGIVHTEDCHEK